MKALPLDWSEEGEQCAGIVCPDCSGAVSVRIEGARRTMFFQCRVGHTFGLVDLLASKEQIIEARLWRALYALEEYADLLDDLGPANAELPRRELIQRRNAMARQHARALRGVLEAEAPLTFDPDEEEHVELEAARGGDE
jgi:hypothetical protein